MAPDDFGTNFYEASNNKLWHEIDAPDGPLFPWDEKSTILRPRSFADLDQQSLLGTYDAYPLLVLGDDITPTTSLPRVRFRKTPSSQTSSSSAARNATI